jgi:hypothetical protein
VRKQYHFWPGEAGLDAWDVDRLVEMSASFGVEEILVASIREIDSVYWFDEPEQPTVRNVVEHVRLIQEVDVSYPIILGPDGRVMDGMHRIAGLSWMARRQSTPSDSRFCLIPTSATAGPMNSRTSAAPTRLSGTDRHAGAVARYGARGRCRSRVVGLAHGPFPEVGAWRGPDCGVRSTCADCDGGAVAEVRQGRHPAPRGPTSLKRSMSGAAAS